MLKIKLIDKYILKKFLVTFLFVVGMLMLIIVVIDFTEKNEKFIKNEVPGLLIFQYYLAFIPWVASLITPITVFITTVLVTSGMAMKTEIVAILSGGISFRRMLVPYLVGAILIASASFYLKGWLIPNSNKYRINFEITYLKKPFHHNEKNMHFRIGDGQYLYIQRYNNRTEQGFKITMEQFDGTELKSKLTAKRMAWDTLTGKWAIKDWQLRTLHPLGETITTGNRLDTLINLAPADFDSQYQLFETLNMDELTDHIELLQSRGAEDIMIYQIEKYTRYMMPFTAIILTLMGVSVSAEKSTRGGAGFKIALGFLIAFGFIIMFILSKAIAEAGSMEPATAIWIPNMVGSVIALVLYRFVPK